MVSEAHQEHLILLKSTKVPNQDFKKLSPLGASPNH